MKIMFSNVVECSYWLFLGNQQCVHSSEISNYQILYFYLYRHCVNSNTLQQSYTLCFKTDSKLVEAFWQAS